MRKLLVLDGQVFQTPAWHRGMGKYSFELLKRLSEINNKDSLWSGSIKLILTSKITLDQEVESKLKELSGIELVFLNLKTNEFDNRQVAHYNRNILNRYLLSLISQEQQNTIIEYAIFSLMQSEIAPVFPDIDNVRNGVILYDLIPFMFHDIYLKDALSEKSYLTKFAELFRADVFLSISKTVANDMSLYLGVDEKRIKSIDGGPIIHSSKSKKINVEKPFILMPTGDDLRKNNLRAVKGFNEFNSLNDNRYTLVITSHFTSHEKMQLSEHSDKIVFTGNISGQELDYLYEETDALLFPSEYEGLGMPILEALNKNKPVACSDISVFREMSESVFNFFNPYSIDEISMSLNNAISQSDYDKKEIEEILNKYSWVNTAEKFTEALNQVGDMKKIPKQELGIYSPSVEGSILGSYIQKLHSELSRDYHITYHLEPHSKAKIENSQTADFLRLTETKLDSTKTSTETNELNIYHIDNNNCTANALACLAIPGVTFLHSVDLKNLWKNLLSDELVSNSRYEAEEKLSKDYCIEDASFVVSIVAISKKIIVSSKEDAKTIAKIINKLELKPSIEVLDYSLGRLPYDNLLKMSREHVVLIGGKTSAYPRDWINSLSEEINVKFSTVSENKNDFDFFNALSSSYAVIIDPKSVSPTESRLIASQAHQLGINNVILLGREKIKNPYIESVDSQNMLSFLKQAKNNANVYTAKKHIEKSFSENFNKIINDIKS